MSTEAVLIANKHTQHKELIMKIRRRIQGVQTAANFVLIEYNIRTIVFLTLAAEKLEAACKITPGQTSPTVQTLGDSSMRAVKSMVPRRDVNAIMVHSQNSNEQDQLEGIGATDIFTTQIQNCRLGHE